MSQLLQVSADVHGFGCAAMHAANTAGGKNADASHSGDHHGGGNGGCAGLAGGQINSHIAAAYLANVFSLAHKIQFIGGKANLKLAADDGGGGGDGAFTPDDLFHLVGKFHVLGEGHTVAQYGALKGNYGLAAVDGLLDLWGNAEIILHSHGVYPLSIIIFSIISTLIRGFMVFGSDIAAIPAARA